jgi:hypothetical protein
MIGQRSVSEAETRYYANAFARDYRRGRLDGRSEYTPSVYFFLLTALRITLGQFNGGEDLTAGIVKNVHSHSRLPEWGSATAFALSRFATKSGSTIP